MSVSLQSPQIYQLSPFQGETSPSYSYVLGIGEIRGTALLFTAPRQCSYTALPCLACLVHIPQTYLGIHKTNCCLLPHIILKAPDRSSIESQDGIMAV